MVFQTLQKIFLLLKTCSGLRNTQRLFDEATCAYCVIRGAQKHRYLELPDVGRYTGPRSPGKNEKKSVWAIGFDGKYMKLGQLPLKALTGEVTTSSRESEK